MAQYLQENLRPTFRKQSINKTLIEEVQTLNGKLKELQQKPSSFLTLQLFQVNIKKRIPSTKKRSRFSRNE